MTTLNMLCEIIRALKSIAENYQGHRGSKNVFIVVCRGQEGNLITRYLIIRRKLVEDVLREKFGKTINRSTLKKVLRALEYKGYIRLLENKQILRKYLDRNACRPYGIYSPRLDMRNDHMIRNYILNHINNREHIIVLALDNEGETPLKEIAKACDLLVNIISH
ncbi:MAG: hypothetical protein J7L38_07925 [Thermoproteales archaeon]|nr:hypothetical protein [Thermoproteales archaeon]